MSLLATALTASVFVTTYGVAVHRGFAYGKWFDLTDFESKSEFITAATDFAQNSLKDANPELCFSDYTSNIKMRGLIEESSISASVWEMFELDADDIEILNAYLSNADMINDSVAETMEHARDNYAGQFDSLADYAEHVFEGNEDYENMPDILRESIDMTDLGRRLTMGMNIYKDHYFHKG